MTLTQGYNTTVILDSRVSDKMSGGSSMFELQDTKLTDNAAKIAHKIL